MASARLKTDFGFRPDKYSDHIKLRSPIQFQISNNYVVHIHNCVKYDILCTTVSEIHIAQIVPHCLIYWKLMIYSSFFFIIIYEYIFTDILYYTKTKYIMLSNSSEQISFIFYFFLISRSGSPSLYMFKTQIHFTCFSN